MRISFSLVALVFMALGGFGSEAFAYYRVAEKKGVRILGDFSSSSPLRFLSSIF